MSVFCFLVVRFLRRDLAIRLFSVQEILNEMSNQLFQDQTKPRSVQDLHRKKSSVFS